MDIDNEPLKKMLDIFCASKTYKKIGKRIDLTYCRLNNSLHNRRFNGVDEDDTLLRLCITIKGGEIIFNNFRESYYLEVFVGKQLVREVKINEFGFEFVKPEEIEEYVLELKRLYF